MIVNQGDMLYSLPLIKSIRLYSYDSTDSFLLSRSSPLGLFRQEDRYAVCRALTEDNFVRGYVTIPNDEVIALLSSLSGNFKVEETFSLEYLVNFYEPNVFSAAVEQKDYEGEKAIFYRHENYWDGITKNGRFCTKCTLEYIEGIIDMNTLTFGEL